MLLKHPGQGNVALVNFRLLGSFAKQSEIKATTVQKDDPRQKFLAF